MNLLPLTIALPLLGYLILSLSRGRLSENQSAIIGAGSIGLSFLVTIYVGLGFHSLPVGAASEITLWHWMGAADFSVDFTTYLDGLSFVMTGIITGVGFLIHLFSTWYMRGEEGYSRFFAYMNLFVASMLILVLGNNLVTLFLGWEGVGLCSYLLIGFIYQDSANGYAARKSFIITRVGDVFLLIGLFLLFDVFGTLNIQEILTAAPQVWDVNSTACNWACLLLLLGAVGKSAQLPLQTWLPDAMAGPTPVSALIHAATMVTAGVYLIARMHGVYILSPGGELLVGYVGGITLLLASFSALAQNDIKRVLAYSTMSQIGYMFVALGVGAWTAGIFHLMVHAFFKALLFLASGAVIVACHHEQDMFKMGGLRKKLPLSYISFLIGGASLSALPVITAGFYSKDQIIWETLASQHPWLLGATLLGAFITPIYTFRMIFLTFHGEAKTEAHPGRGISFWLPLVVLSVLSTFVGAIVFDLPLEGVLPASPSELLSSHSGLLMSKEMLEVTSGGLAIIGIIIAALLYLGRRQFITAVMKNRLAQLLRHWWYKAWGFDWLYDVIFCRPYTFLARINRNDIVATIGGLLPASMRLSNRAMAVLENGNLRWYAGSIGLGAAAVLVVLFLV